VSGEERHEGSVGITPGATGAGSASKRWRRCGLEEPLETRRALLTPVLRGSRRGGTGTMVTHFNRPVGRFGTPIFSPAARSAVAAVPHVDIEAVPEMSCSSMLHSRPTTRNSHDFSARTGTPCSCARCPLGHKRGCPTWCQEKGRSFSR
jgi:hypothetical protein